MVKVPNSPDQYCTEVASRAGHIWRSRFCSVIQNLFPGQYHYKNKLFLGQASWNNVPTIKFTIHNDNSIFIV